MSGGYNPVVAHPGRFRVQTKSEDFQAPFYFGGSQVPCDLFLARSHCRGGNIAAPMHPIDAAFATARGNEVNTRKGHNIKLTRCMPFMK